MNNLQFSVDKQGVAILGSEYCSGYIDTLGRWNTGFYCPASDETVKIFCCGSDNYKYCCTEEDEVLQEEMECLTVVIGVMMGAFTALLLLTIVSCIYCPWCTKKKESEKQRGCAYHLPHTSASGVSNTYSASIGMDGSTTLLTPSLTGQDTARPSQQAVQLYRQGMSHSHTLPHSLSHHHSFMVTEESDDTHETDRIFGTNGRYSRDQPPAYHILPRASYLLVPQDTPDLLRKVQDHILPRVPYPLIPQDTPDILSETKEKVDTALHSFSQTMAKVNMVEMDKEEESTKF